MRFFTVDAYNSWYDTYEDSGILDAAFQQYRQYLDELETILPAHILTLARLRGVHDGLLVKAKRDRDRSSIMLTLRCGDLQMGYYDLILQYEQASISSQDEQTLAQIARTTKNESRHESDLYYHDVDLSADGNIEHRLLFHPGVWFAIRCHALHWDKVDCPDRKLPRLKVRFISA